MSGDLHVVWAGNGRTSIYAGVDAEHAESIMNAPSVGSALYGLRRTHKHRYDGD